MKTTFTSTSVMRNLVAAFALAFTLFAGNASAQSVQFADNAAIHTQTSDQFKVAVFPVENSLLMKVLFENPAKERVTVLIKNSNNEVVYKKAVGNAPIFIGKFDVSKMTDGNYTMVIESKNQSYSNPFSVQTYQERIARAL
ncbi:hypothetical protein GXP67_26965 [Rhodocytophaga rosea]|uniref:DUF3244 domain-containing protein n=1 Tax=Rhodocytophaga rosea TaxID=2704465 RepID=A0A6C0GQ22_9BACT|nr:DUF3244 domain-containing protein [Rhodocytophaga rosea]QHT70027.1 hypothetical protein GXP67_26965 [Rhodocytophaga rosea]